MPWTAEAGRIMAGEAFSPEFALAIAVAITPGDVTGAASTKDQIAPQASLLEPLNLAEPAIEKNADGEHHDDHHGVAVSPFGFGHEVEIHAVEPRDHRGHGDDGGPRGQPLG